MRSATLLLAAVLFACVSCSVQQSWNVTSPNLTSVLMGVSFNVTTQGYVSGAGILNTLNGGRSWQLSGPAGFEDAIYMDIETIPNSGYALSTGLVIGQRPAAVYTTNGGRTWVNSATLLEAGAFQDAQALTSSNVFLFGDYTIFKQGSGTGFGFSSNGGNTFTFTPWNSETSARYGSFVSPTTGWIAGGQWPETESDSNVVRSLSRHVHLVHGNKLIYTPSPRFAAPPPNATFNGWRAVISSTNNGGQTWKTLVNYTSTDPNNGYYLNGIWFVNSNLGFVAGEGTAGGFAFAFINRTTDGGSTWTTVLNLPGGSLIQIKFLNANYGWAVGGVGANFGATQQFWLTTDGGNNWTPYSVKYDYCTNINIINTQLAYATLVTPFQTSSVATYN